MRVILDVKIGTKSLDWKGCESWDKCYPFFYTVTDNNKLTIKVYVRSNLSIVSLY